MVALIHGVLFFQFSALMSPHGVPGVCISKKPCSCTHFLAKSKLCPISFAFDIVQHIIFGKKKYGFLLGLVIFFHTAHYTYIFQL